jgi:hypothetical protein
MSIILRINMFCVTRYPEGVETRIGIGIGIER